MHVITAVLQAAGESALASEREASQRGARVARAFPEYLRPWAAAPPSPPLLASALPPSAPLAAHPQASALPSAHLQASAPQVSVLPSAHPQVSAPQVSAPRVSALPAAAAAVLLVAALLQVSAALVAVLPSSVLLAAAAPAARLYTKPQAPRHPAVSDPNALPSPPSATL